ncbi:putative aldo-keto reductase [Phaeomoniella chlamydospora]|uniref:Putative aldo-keto reductase n=1 Tax=Phaeomoniella chlamydospora TaxID=158046 RepID=A0A0G2H5A7_PHACM|nr:putative aldo-keto reductase [Phaeomoniella chlamydospora]
MAAVKLPTVPLGKIGSQVTRLGFGMMGLSAFYGAVKSDEERLQLLDEVYAAGELFWDSADVYGDSEDLIGKWFKRSGKRSEIFLATKFGGMSINNDPEYIKECCNNSLQRLGTDYIDLYYCHRVNKDQPIEITIQTMAELKKQGKVKHLGISECSANTLRRACAVEHIDAIQMEYSPWALEIEQLDILQTARELGVAVIAYAPLGRGFLTGRYKSPKDFPEGDFRTLAPRFSAENFHKNLDLADRFLTISKKHGGCTPGQLTLAWLMAQGDDIIPIPGTTNLANFKENIGSLNVKITEEEEAEIRKAVNNMTPEGERYPESFAGVLIQETVPLK